MGCSGMSGFLQHALIFSSLISSDYTFLKIHKVKATMEASSVYLIIPLFSLLCPLCQVQTKRNKPDYSKVRPLVYVFLCAECAFLPVCAFTRCSNLCCLCVTFPSIFPCFIFLFSPVYLLAQHLTEQSKRSRTSFHCNLYRS